MGEGKSLAAIVSCDQSKSLTVFVLLYEQQPPHSQGFEREFVDDGEKKLQGIRALPRCGWPRDAAYVSLRHARQGRGQEACARERKALENRGSLCTTRTLSST